MQVIRIASAQWKDVAPHNAGGQGTPGHLGTPGTPNTWLCGTRLARAPDGLAHQEMTIETFVLIS
jgi:hypothetical protein